MRLTDKVLRAIRWDTLGSVTTSAITFLTTVWLVRVLDEKNYGVLASLLAFLGLAQLLASGGVRYLLLRFVPQAMKEGGLGAVTKLLQQAIWSRASFLIALSLPLLLYPEKTASLVLGRPDLAKYLPYVPLLVAPPLFTDLVSAALIALFHQPVVRLSELFNKTVFACCLLAIPLWGDPIYGVFAAWVAGWIAGIALLVTSVVRNLSFQRPDAEYGQSPGQWLRFSGAAYGLSLIGYVLGRELDVLLLTRLGINSEVLAQYAVCFTFVNLAYRLPMLPISGGFDVPLIADLYTRGDNDAMQRVFRASFEYLYIFVLPLVGGGLILGPPLLSAIYGESYGRATDIYFPLLILLGLTKLTGVFGSFLIATDREGASLRIRLTMSAVNFGLAVAAIPRFGASGAAWATGLTMVGLLVWEGTVVQRLLHPRYPWGFLLRVVAAVAVMMVVTYGLRVRLWAAPSLLLLLGITGVGALVYFIMLMWLRPVSAEHGKMLEGIGIPWIAQIASRLGQPDPSPRGRG